MKIKKIIPFVKHIELKTPFKTALRETSLVEYVQLHVEDENGFIGVGEAPATKAITNEDIDDILNSIENVKGKFVGLTCSEALEVLHSRCKIGSSAKSAFDLAFVSLHVRQNSFSFVEYFKTQDTSSIKTDITISLNPLDVMLEDAKKAYADGMDILKVKLGSDINHAIDTTKVLSKELPEVQLLIDANQAWSVEDSLKYVEAVKYIKLELVEQPVIASDIDGLKTITDASHVDILADEVVFDLADVKRVVESKSADMINIKFMKCGGVTKAIEILEYARQNSVTCMLGSMLEGPNSINIALHVAMAYRDVIKYVDLDSPLLYKEPSDELDFEFKGCEISLKT